jgi:hypothetical protein
MSVTATDVQRLFTRGGAGPVRSRPGRAGIGGVAPAKNTPGVPVFIEGRPVGLSVDPSRARDFDVVHSTWSSGAATSR